MKNVILSDPFEEISPHIKLDALDFDCLQSCRQGDSCCFASRIGCPALDVAVWSLLELGHVISEQRPTSGLRR